MRKITKEILTHPLFIVCFCLSVLALTIFFLSYSNQNESYNPQYNIVYHKDIDDYNEQIQFIEEQMKNLDKKDKYYERNKKYSEDTILIYEKLKENNINYSKCYDFGPGNSMDRNVFLYKAPSLLILLSILNALVIIYIAFTREFDNLKYSYVYEYTRYKIVSCKAIVSFLFSVFTFLVLYFILWIFSLMLEEKYQMVVLVENEVYFQNINIFILKDVFLTELYCLTFVFASIFAIALFTKKTAFTCIGVAILILLVFMMSYLRIPLVVLLGLDIRSDLISYTYYPLTRLSIIIPIAFLALGFYRFEKEDL